MFIIILNSWNKHTDIDFEFFIIEECKKEELNLKEIYWISHYNSYDINHGFNKTMGGDGALGRKFSKASIEKIRNSLKGSKRSTETKLRISKTSKGKLRNKGKSKKSKK